MGMGFQEISVFNEPPFFQTLVNQGVVASPEFGVKLATTGSELFLGGVDSALFTGPLTSVPVTTVVGVLRHAHLSCFHVQWRDVGVLASYHGLDQCSRESGRL